MDQNKTGVFFFKFDHLNSFDNSECTENKNSVVIVMLVKLLYWGRKVGDDL